MPNTTIDIRGRDHTVGMLDGEPSVGLACDAVWAGKVCGATASPHYCEPRVALVEAGMSKLQSYDFVGNFVPLRWQREDIIEPLFGVVVWHDGWNQWVRRYKVLYCTVPRKNGKTMIMAAVVAVLMKSLRQGSHMLIGAQNKKEAKEVIGGMLRRLVESTPDWKKDIRYMAGDMTFENKTKEISCRITAISDSNSARGAAWSVAVLDEVAFLPYPDETIGVVRASWGPIREPLIVLISTLPYDAMSWGRVTNRAMMSALADPSEKPDTLPVIYQLGDGDDWRDEDVWRKCNPGLGEVPPIMDINEFRLQARAAENDFAERRQLIGERLNGSPPLEQSYIELPVWEAQKDVSSRDKIFKELAGLKRGVYVGVDFSLVSDFSSVGVVASVGESFLVWQHSWIPEPVVEHLDKYLGGQVREWVAGGYLDVMPEGASSRWTAEQVSLIVSKLAGFEIVMFDQHEAEQAAIFWETNNVAHQRVPQGRVLSPALKALKRAVDSGAVKHGGDPVLRYAVECAQVEITSAEKWALRKPDRRVEAARIDPLVAVVCAIKAWDQLEDTGWQPMAPERAAPSMGLASRVSKDEADVD